MELPKSKNALRPSEVIAPMVSAGRSGIYAVDVDTGSERLITEYTGRRLFSPLITADRRTVFYGESTGAVVAVAADGSNPTTIIQPDPGCQELSHISLAPTDRQQILVQCRAKTLQSRKRVNASVAIYDLDGTLVARLPFGSRIDDPTLSPDGAQVVFWESNDVEGKTDGGSLAKMSMDDSHIVSLLTDQPSGVDADPAWSPDGTQIAFRRQSAKGTSDIYTVNSAGGRPQPVLVGDGLNDRPSFSPDGTQVVAVRRIRRERTTSFVLVLSDRTGSTHRIVSREHPQILGPTWATR